MNRNRAVEDPRLLVPAEVVRLSLLGDRARRRNEVEGGPKTATFGPAADLVERAEHGATERRGWVIAPPWKRGFSPEVEPVDVAVREVHRTLMRLVVVFTRDVGRHRKPARHDGTVCATKGEEIGFRDRRIKVIRGKGVPSNQHVDVAPLAYQLDRLERAKGRQAGAADGERQEDQWKKASCAHATCRACAASSARAGLLLLVRSGPTRKHNDDMQIGSTISPATVTTGRILKPCTSASIEQRSTGTFMKRNAPRASDISVLPVPSAAHASVTRTPSPGNVSPSAAVSVSRGRARGTSVGLDTPESTSRAPRLAS